MKNKPILILSISLLIGNTGCEKEISSGTPAHIRSVTEKIDDYRLAHVEETSGDWLSYGRNYQEDRFSPLDQITKSNIDSLGLAWSYNLGTKRGVEATPIVVDGIMYVTGPWSVVYAIDARKGELLWKYDPKVSRQVGATACCGMVNRGVALYKGLVYVGALDGRLIAIDAVTGESKWEKVTVDTTKNYTITGAPRVVDGNVIIGNGGAEYGVRGYITAYNAMTGEKKWRFYTVPGNPSLPFESKAMEEAAKTWTGKWWEYGGGGTAWDAMAYDPNLNLLYVGVGNGSPWNRWYRSPEGGDNLYLSSIIALRPQNGELVWHYQTTPGDNWDYTATQHLILADLNIAGQERQVIMQAPKNGFFYVLDRVTGEFISAEPYVYTNWATHIDKTTGRPIENELTSFKDRDVQVSPSPYGGHNWQPMAYNPITKLVYIPTHETSIVFGQEKDWEFDGSKGKQNQAHVWGGNGPEDEALMDTLGPGSSPVGRLIAWDPIDQKEVWRVEYNEVSWNGGLLTTKSGMVFQGLGDGMFKAYDAENGDELWKIDLGTGILATPVTFEMDGIQYVSIAVGWGGPLGKGTQFTEFLYPGTVYTFALGINNPLPDYPKPTTKILADFDFDSDEETLKRGMDLYQNYCGHCHTQIARGTGGAIPDLGYMAESIYKSFEQIVLKGLFIPMGMPSFKDQLTDNDVAEIKNYIMATAAGKKEEIKNGNNR